MSSARSPHVVLVSPFSELTTIPSVYALVRHLESRQVPVSLFVPGAPGAAMGSTHSECTRVYGHFPNWRMHGFWRLLSTEKYIELFALRMKLRHHWSVMVVLNGLGLGNAQLLNRLLGLPVWYWSLEILFDEELHQYDVGAFRRWREFEKLHLPGCKGGIIQDESKAEAFRCENPCFRDKPLLVFPNTLAGRARRAKKWQLHEQFGLAREKRIALYSGSFSASNCVDDIALSIKAWPPNWVLLIHSRHSVGGEGNLAFAKRLLEKVSPKGRLFFTSSPLSPEKLPDLLDSVDVGLAFYGVDEALVLSRRNNQLMGHSSGKVNAYLQAGLPIIVNDFTSMSEWVAASGSGTVIREADQIGEALRSMEASLDEYSRRGIEYYNRHLCLDRHLDSITDQVLGLADSGPLCALD